MMSAFLLDSLFRSGIAVVVGAVLVSILLRCCRCRNARVHRLAWFAVVLQGILWIHWPLKLELLAPEPVAVIAVADTPSIPHEISAPPIPDADSVAVAEPVGVTENIVQTSTEKPETRCAAKTQAGGLGIFGFWIAGMMGIVIFHFFCFVRLVISLRTATPASDEHLAEWNLLQNTERKIGLLLTEQIGPAIVRLPRGETVLVPKSLWEESPKDVRLGILKHELSHARHRDGVKSLLFTALASVQWFNPAAWWALKKFNEAAEWRCDAEAYGNGDDSVVRFAESMLLLHRTSPRYVGVLPAFRNRDLTERIRRLEEHRTHPKEPTMKHVSMIFCLAVLFCFGLVKIDLVAKTPPKEPGTERTRAVPGLVHPGIAASTPPSPALDGNSIRGKVVDETKNPVAGAKVRILGESAAKDQEATTNENGEFTLEKPDGNFFYGSVYAVDADRKRFGTAHWLGNARTQKIGEVTIPLRKTERVVTGTVVDAEGRPAEGILVAGSYQSVHSEIVRTDKEGKFQFLYPEKLSLLRLIAYKKGVGFDICPTEEIDPYQPMGEVAVTPPDKISDGPFALKLSPIEPVKIRVVDQEGKPLAGAMVNPWLIQKPCELPKQEPAMWGSPYVKERHSKQFNTTGLNLFDALTDADGIATIDTVPKTFLDGSTFYAHGPSGGVVQSDKSKRYYGSVNSLWKEMKIVDGLPTLTLPRQGSVKGTVKLEDGTPVPDVHISVRWHNGSGGGRETDKNGEFNLNDNANVIYNLSFDSDKGAAPAVFNYSVGDGSDEKKLDIVLKPGIRLHGKVFMPDGSPADHFYVTVGEKDPNPPTSFTTNPVGFNSPERRSGTVYTTDEADKYLSFGDPNNFPSEKKEKLAAGEYETFLPAVPREYRFRAVRHPSKENSKEITANVQDVRLLGTEKEFKLDFYLSEKGDNNCTPLANTPSTPTTEKAKPVKLGERKPWVDTSNNPKSPNPMIPADPTVKVLDENGKPMKDVEIEIQFNGDDRGSFKVKTDENGVASVKELEKKKNTGFVGYQIRHNGYVFRIADWQRGYGAWNTIPKEHVFTMEKGTVVGGIVVDENNKPIQGASVECQYYAPDREHHLYSAGNAKTDADGKWSVNRAPASMHKFRLDVKHPDYVQSELTGTYPPYPQMLDKTAVVMLRKGASLNGKVLGLDGKPIKDAKIVVTEKDREFSLMQPQKTKEDGTFRFDNLKPGSTNVYVAAVGFAPQMEECTDFSKPIEFTLESGKTVKFKVLDMDGKPIAKARVCPFRWRGTFLLLGDSKLIPQHADNEGNWTWTWAPDDEVEYSIIREGYQSIRDLKLKAQDEPFVYRMRLPLEIRGKVSDAETGEPIKNITLTSGGNFDGKNPRQAAYWNKDRPSKFTDGNYRAFFDEPRNGGGHHFMLEADGYEPFVSEMFTDDQGSLTLDVKLARKQ